MERISEIINRLQRGEPKLSQAAWSRKWGVSEGKLAAMQRRGGRGAGGAATATGVSAVTGQKPKK